MDLFKNVPTWALYLFSYLALGVLMIIRAAVWPEVPVDPAINALNYFGGLVGGALVAQVYGAQRATE